MRLWSLHPKYLDAKGLVALWREALLAQKVLMGATKGYRNHPQLQRLKDHDHPLGAMAVYLNCVHAEALARNYRFDASKINPDATEQPIEVTDGQLLYELNHLKEKLKIRDQKKYNEVRQVRRPLANPIFVVVPGNVEPWEKSKEPER
jgi:hypothetical protein